MLASYADEKLNVSLVCVIKNIFKKCSGLNQTKGDAKDVKAVLMHVSVKMCLFKPYKLSPIGFLTCCVCGQKHLSCSVLFEEIVSCLSFLQLLIFRLSKVFKCFLI